ncbi:hypothetical protein Tco_1375381, partial [Tanacetum coccineum]
DKYVADILKKFDFLSIRIATTPIESNKPLVKDEDGVDVDVHVYMSMIGSLMYLTASRPDIMFVVCACARFQVTPKASHLNAVKRIFSLDRKSTISGCQFLGRRLISWQCKKQTIVANSTTEAEYVTAANCCGQNPVAHSRTKHIEIRFHFIRDCYEKRLIDVIKIYTNHNVADLLTKGFDVTRYTLTHNPTIYDSLVKQFSQTATVRTLANGTQQIVASIDSKEYTITEASVRSKHQLADTTGIHNLFDAKIYAGLAIMEKELKETKQTLGNAVLKLVKKVKSLEIALKRKSKKVIMSGSEGKEPEDQGRIIQDINDDRLVSLFRESMKDKSTDFVTPTKASREAQEEEISPTILEAAKTLSKVASQSV